MDKKTQNGFSVIELLVVLVIIGIISTIAVPSLLKARQAAENEGTRSSLRALVSTQMSYFATKGRYGRLGELNAVANGGFGTVVGQNLVRNKFTFVMTPANPSDTELQKGFHITVTKSGDLSYTLDVDESGSIIDPYSDAR